MDNKARAKTKLSRFIEPHIISEKNRLGETTSASTKSLWNSSMVNQGLIC